MERDMDEGSIYLVRVWRRPGEFRASVRSVADEDLHLFSAPEDLARYFADCAAPVDPPSTARRRSTHGG